MKTLLQGRVFKIINSKCGHVVSFTLTVIFIFTTGAILGSIQAVNIYLQDESYQIDQADFKQIDEYHQPISFSTYQVISENDNALPIVPNIKEIEEIETREENVLEFLDEIIEIIFFIDEALYEIPCDIPDEEERPTRDDPIYEVFKNTYPVNVPAELQWFIRDLAEEHNFCERVIFGLILGESTFNVDAVSPSGKHFGLAQISSFWIRRANIPRLTDDWKDRDLFDPHDNLITLMELWLYARDVYDLDTDEELDMKRLIYWHNTGKNPVTVSNWPFSNLVFRFADELVEIQYE